MIQIWELETRNGRIFKVVTANKSQEKRLIVAIDKHKATHIESFIRVEVVVNGIHDIK